MGADRSKKTDTGNDIDYRAPAKPIRLIVDGREFVIPSNNLELAGVWEDGKKAYEGEALVLIDADDFGPVKANANPDYAITVTLHEGPVHLPAVWDGGKELALRLEGNSERYSRILRNPKADQFRLYAFAKADNTADEFYEFFADKLQGGDDTFFLRCQKGGAVCIYQMNFEGLRVDVNFEKRYLSRWRLIRSSINDKLEKFYVGNPGITKQ